jgi:glucokinase
MNESETQGGSPSQPCSEHQHDSAANRWAIGIDIGGTKTAAGLIDLADGRIMARRLQPTPRNDGAAVLEIVIEFARSLVAEAKTMNLRPASIGIGVCELVTPSGEIVSEASIPWKGQPIAGRVFDKTHLPVSLDADVRVAARAEARLGAGRNFRSFLYVTVGTGISASFVLDAAPYVGARGLTGTFASSPSLVPLENGTLVSGPALEHFAAGPAIAARLAALEPAFDGAAPDVLAMADAGHAQARMVVETAAQALGAAIGQLINVLDPQGIVLGGGLGLASGLYRKSIVQGCRQHVWAEPHRGIPLISAQMGADAGIIGAALRAAESPVH